MDLKYLNSTLKNLDSCFNRVNELPKQEEPKVLFVDLEEEISREITIPSSWISSYVGGPALGLRIWADCVSNNDTNPIVILSGRQINSGCTDTDVLTIVFRSPENGQVVTHTVRAGFSLRLASCGFFAIVFSGRARRYCHVSVSQKGAEIVLTEQFTHLMISEISRIFFGMDSSTLITGPACEIEIPFSNAFVDGKSTGRGGLGCALAQKNIRVVSVNSNLVCPDEKRSEVDNLIEQSSYCRTLENYGAFSLIERAFKKGWAPVLNYSKRTDPRLFHLTPLEVIRRMGDAFDGEKDYESILMLGPNCGCFEIGTILDRINLCEEFGVDPVSFGNCFANVGPDGRDFEDFLGSVCVGERNLPKSKMSINGLECGGVDYRGAKACGLNSALGNTFNLVFDIGLGLCEKDEPAWVVFYEDLIWGLESCGLYPHKLIPAMWDSLKPLQKRLCFRAPEKLQKTMDKDFFPELGINGNLIFQTGKKTWRLKTEINKALGCKAPMLPDFFCVDPRSNYKEDSIVPLFSLLQRYNKLRENTIICQTAEAKSN